MRRAAGIACSARRQEDVVEEWDGVTEGTSSGRHTQAYTHDCTVLADSSHGDSHVGSVSPAATRTRTRTLTRTLILTLTLSQP